MRGRPTAPDRPATSGRGGRRDVLQRFREHDDAGVVAILAAILVVVIFGAAAIAVDVARLYTLTSKMQKAADAAALAAVPYLPSDPSTAATVARQVAAANGFPTSDARYTVNVTTPWNGRASRVRVAITARQSNVFGPVIGVPTSGAERFAVADYAGPVPMGSPCNLYGNEPPATGGAGSARSDGCRNLPDPSAPGFWANTFAPGANKEQGDRFAPRLCNSRTATDNFRCDAGSNVDYYGRAATPTTPGITGLPYYIFRISVGAAIPQLDVQMFDPVAATVGDNCEATPWPGGTWAGSDTPNPFVTDARTRYTLRSWTPTGSGAFCTGDNQSGANTVTSFALINPTDTFNPLNSTVVPGCFRQFRGVGALTADMLTAGRPTYNAEIAASFRQWVSVCTSPVVNPQLGDYYLMVRTNIPWGAPAARMLNPAEDPTVGGNALNRYGLRAVVPTGTAAQRAAVQFAALERMPMYGNIPGGRSTTFNLARVNSSNADRNLIINLYDVGEGMGGGTITILQPDGSNVPVCIAEGDALGTQAAPVTLPNCALTGVTTARHNGRNQIMRVPIPTTYSCNDADPTACWWLVRFDNFSPVGSPGSNDTTTWTASIDGDPVRLIQ